MRWDNHNVIKKLHSASPKQSMCMVTPLKKLLNDLYQPSSVAENYVAKAHDFSESLLKTTTENVIMHGDLHHDNVIYDEVAQSWKIIDPAGVIGDPIYEYTSFMINPIDKIWKGDNALSIIENRAQKFSKIADIDPYRLRKWTFVKAVLCLIWTEGTQNQDRLELVKLFNRFV
ncbi:MAG: phosphotransferase [Alphaproteobacteria bacterium]|nr:phosphotransferase [Alphaproteobacteria bacterium]